MTTAHATYGPASRALENELHELARQHGIVVWLDGEGVYDDFADRLIERSRAGQFAFPVHGFRGSYLALLLALEHAQNDIAMTPLIVHLPGHTEDDVADSPLYELYRAGRRHRRALPTLVRTAARGRRSTADVEAFLARPDLSLAAADAWLRGDPARAGDEREGPRGPDLSSHSAESLVHDLRPGQPLAQALRDAHDTADGDRQRTALLDAIFARGDVLLGLSSELRELLEHRLHRAEPRPDELAGNALATLAGFALCAEFVSDLRRPPYDEWLQPLTDLSGPHVAACRALASHLRQRDPDLYQQVADELEECLPRSMIEARAADLGRIDTFRFEDRVMLRAALDELGHGRHRQALDWTRDRLDGASFWAARDRRRQQAWQLCAQAAQLALAAREHEDLLAGATSLDVAAERYAERGQIVDRLHRKLEQQRVQAGILALEEWPELQARLDDARRVYRAWADALAVAFNDLCRERGFVPDADAMQRTLFDQVVRPMCDGTGTVALFLVDGLRYEMGQQLCEALLEGTRRSRVTIKPRLAELPTVTEMGMNALAPVADGTRLRVDIDRHGKIAGLRPRGGARVSSPAQRRELAHASIGGSKCPPMTLQELRERDLTSVKRAVAGARLCIVHSEDIDKAGENGTGLQSFEGQLRALREGCRKLHQAGVKRFVITADHGFLLHDPVTRAPIAHGKRTDPKRRHVLTAHGVASTGEVVVGFRELGYQVNDDDPEMHVVMPASIAPFDLGSRTKDYAHGGNSLQERVIPVLTVGYRHAAKSRDLRFQIELSRATSVMGAHCLGVRVLPIQQLDLAFSGPRTQMLLLECADDPQVAVELCDARGADIVDDLVRAPVGETFELFFRLSGPREDGVRVRLRHAARVDVLDPMVSQERFAVIARAPALAEVNENRPQEAPASKADDRAATTAAEPPARGTDDWLQALPAGGVRDVFRHIAVHGSINRAQATDMLGSARAFRRFSNRLEDYARLAPFSVRADMSSGDKCYVRGDR